MKPTSATTNSRERRAESGPSRRIPSLTPFRATCEKESLNERLGPGDFDPPSKNSVEESWNQDIIQAGLVLEIPGIDEQNELSYTLLDKKMVDLRNVVRHKEVVNHGLVFLRNMQIVKKKLGQVYGIPLSDEHLAKSGTYPEQQNVAEDLKLKFLEELGGRKRLKTLGQMIPHGFRKKSLFEALIQHKVPLYRATWFIKCLFLNQVRNSGTGHFLDTHQKRVELWTNDLLDYTKSIWEDLLTQNQIVDSSRNNQLTKNDSTISNLYEKWAFVKKLIPWHIEEGFVDKFKVLEKVLEWFQKDVLEGEAPIEFSKAVFSLFSSLASFYAGNPSFFEPLKTCVKLTTMILEKMESNEPVKLSGLVAVKKSMGPNLEDNLKAVEVFSELLKTMLSAVRNPQEAVEMGPFNWENFLAERKFSSLMTTSCPLFLYFNEGELIQTLHECRLASRIDEASQAVFQECGFLGGRSLKFTLSLSEGKSTEKDYFKVKFLCDWATSSRSFEKGGKTQSFLPKVYFVVSILKRRNFRFVEENRSIWPHRLVTDWLDEKLKKSAVLNEPVMYLLSELTSEKLFSPNKFLEWQIAQGSSAESLLSEVGVQKLCDLTSNEGVNDNFESGVKIENREKTLEIGISNKRKLEVLFMENSMVKNFWFLDKIFQKKQKLEGISVLSPLEFKEIAEEGNLESQKEELENGIFLSIAFSLAKLLNFSINLGHQIHEEVDLEKSLEDFTWVDEPDEFEEDDEWLFGGERTKIPKKSVRAEEKVTSSFGEEKNIKVPKFEEELGELDHLDPQSLEEQILNLDFAQKMSLADWLCFKIERFFEGLSQNQGGNGEFSGGRRLTVFSFASGHDFGDLNLKKLTESAEFLEMSDDCFLWIVHFLDICGRIRSIGQLLISLIGLVFRKEKCQKNSGDVQVLVSESLLLHSLKRYEKELLSLDLMPKTVELLFSEASKPNLSSLSCQKILLFVGDLVQRSRDSNFTAEVKQKLKSIAFSQDFDIVRSQMKNLGLVGKMTPPKSVNQNTAENLQRDLQSVLLQHLGPLEGEGKLVKSSSRELETAAKDTAVNFFEKFNLGKEKEGLLEDSFFGAISEVVLNSVVEMCVSFLERHFISRNGFFVSQKKGLETSAMAETLQKILFFHVKCVQELKALLEDLKSVLTVDNSLVTQASAMADESFSSYLKQWKKLKRNLRISPETPDSSVTFDEDTKPAVLELIEDLFPNRNPVSCIIAAFLISGVSNGALPWEMVMQLAVDKSTKSLPPQNIRHFWVLTLAGCPDKVLGPLIDSRTNLAILRIQRTFPLPRIFRGFFSAFTLALEEFLSIENQNSSSRDGNSSSQQEIVLETLRHSSIVDLYLQETKSLYSSICTVVNCDSYLQDGTFSRMLDTEGREDFLLACPRLFLLALLEKKFPEGDSLTMSTEVAMAQAVQILDEFQPSNFHWQWLLLRLILSEQAAKEKASGGRQNLKAVLEVVFCNNKLQEVCEWDKNFVEALATRLLFRPDSASLYSELVHVLGRGADNAMEAWLILWVGWFLKGSSSLISGHKSVRQHLENHLRKEKFFQRPSRFKQNTEEGVSTMKSEEEGSTSQVIPKHPPFFLEQALAALILPCIVRASESTQMSFEFDLVMLFKQIEETVKSHLESQSANKTPSSPAKGTLPRSSSLRGKQRGGFGGSSQPGRLGNGTSSSAVVEPAVVHSSLWLLLQFLLPRLSNIHRNRDPNHPGLRQTLSQIVLGLLCSRTIQEAPPFLTSESLEEAYTTARGAELLAGMTLFDVLSSVFQALISPKLLPWLQREQTEKNTKGGPLKQAPLNKDIISALYREAQNARLEEPFRSKIVSLFPSAESSTSILRVNAAVPTICDFGSRDYLLQTPVAKSPSQGQEAPASGAEINSWNLLEEGTNGNFSNSRANPILKGATRMKRKLLTYTCIVAEDLQQAEKMSTNQLQQMTAAGSASGAVGVVSQAKEHRY